MKSEEEMRQQFVFALHGFFLLHPEYKTNPLWVTGESYAGKYVPSIAYELAMNAPDIPFQGIIMGNGMYNYQLQVTSIGDFAFGAGVIDEKLLEQEQEHVREQSCLDAIAGGSRKAGDFCENQTVRWLYTGPEAVAGELFYYDFGMTDAHELDAITDQLGTYLNSAEVKAALHAGSATWQNADEEGPAAEALAADFVLPSTPVVEKLLAMGRKVFMYNGVRDGSLCNHIGNLRSLLALQWEGSAEFAASPNRPWPSAQEVMGHVRGTRNLVFATVMRTGHLVPTVVPEAYAILLDMALSDAPSRNSSQHKPEVLAVPAVPAMLAAPELPGSIVV